MNSTLRHALPAAFLAIIAKMSYFLTISPDEEWGMYVRFFYLLVLLVALFAGIRDRKKSNPRSDFPTDIKTGMKITSVFAIVITLFTWLYYGVIDQQYFAERIQTTVDSVDPATQNLENIQNSAEFIFNSFTHATITLFGMMVIGFLYTVVIVMIIRAKPDVFVRR